MLSCDGKPHWHARIHAILTFIALLQLDACANAQQQSQPRIQQQLTQRAHECENQPRTRKNALAQDTCFGSAVKSVYQEAHYPYMWLVDKLVLQWHQATVDYVKGKISAGELDTRKTDSNSQFFNDEHELRARDQQLAIMTHQQTEQSDIQMYQVLQGMQPRPYVPPPAPSPSTTICNPFGRSVICNTSP